ncbi:MAG: right-handed parallel beta-helix repeat-containing protein [Candidatus Vogelbacteria bacterium]|nr:right-handed parallel beta-helix repeat-containing protein [Candidatus Vogelbacteria bacterium]
MKKKYLISRLTLVLIALGWLIPRTWALADTSFVSLGGQAIQGVVNEYLDRSDRLVKRLDELTAVRATLPIWNDGADYGAELQRLIDALPPAGGTITIAPGRYLIKQRVQITKNNVAIASPQLGAVFFEDGGAANGLLDVGARSGVTISQIVFWGAKRGRVTALSAGGARRLVIQQNGFINFDTALLIDAGSTILDSGIIVQDNLFFKNGYLTLRVEGSRQSTPVFGCDAVVGGARVENNFLAGNYQGINFLCVNDSVVAGNIIRDSDIGGLRLETSARNLIERNLSHENQLMGIWLYATSVGNQLRDNIIIDNNQSRQPFAFDCWEPPESIKQAYLYNRDPDRVSYPYRERENGQFVFTNYFCQFNGDEVELRNAVSRNSLINNLIGRYRTTDNPVSAHDLRISLYPIFYGWSGRDLAVFLSRDNQITNNVFLNSGASRLLDQGCGNSFTGNQSLALSNGSAAQLTPLALMANADYQALCQGQALCNANRRCEPERGEWLGNCASDCPALRLGDQGSRTRHDQCLAPAKITEPIFPARPGCTNVYDGSFRCTNRDNGQCDSEQGENYCNSFDCARVAVAAGPVCGNGVIEGTEQCDGANLNNQTCVSRGFTGGGTLSCTSSCTFNTSQCTATTADTTPPTVPTGLAPTPTATSVEPLPPRVFTLPSDNAVQIATLKARLAELMKILITLLKQKLNQLLILRGLR